MVGQRTPRSNRGSLRGSVLAGLRHRLTRSWVHPRRLGGWYLERAVLRALPPGKPLGRVLDIGCGRRPYEALLRARGADYLGLDLPGRDTGEQGPDIVGDACSLPFRAGIADTIVCTEVLEHVPEPEQLLRELRRVIADNGTLILSAPFFEPLHEEPYDFTRYTAYGLQAFVKRAGFHLCRIERRGGWWSVTLGSLVGQALYDAVAPRRGIQRRRTPAILLVLPALTLLQVIALILDHLLPSKRVAIGHLVLAEPTQETPMPLAAEQR